MSIPKMIFLVKKEKIPSSQLRKKELIHTNIT